VFDVVFVDACVRSCLPETVLRLKLLYEESHSTSRGGPSTSEYLKRRKSEEVAEGEDAHGHCGCSHLLRAGSRYVLEEEGDESSGSRREDFLINFRELLWFWREYYEHRGRDRLSLEFSSHIRFPEWKAVVDLLCMDTDQVPTCLVSRRGIFPRSPYSLPPRRPRTSISLRNSH